MNRVAWQDALGDRPPVFLAGIASLILVATAAAAEDTPLKPDLLVILTDDQGSVDAGLVVCFAAAR